MKRITLKFVLESLREDLRKAVKDLKGDFRFVRQEIAQVDKKIDDVEGRLNGKFSEVTKHVDGFAKNQLKFDAELAAGQSARERLAESASQAGAD